MVTIILCRMTRHWLFLICLYVIHSQQLGTIVVELLLPHKQGMLLETRWEKHFSQSECSKCTITYIFLGDDLCEKVLLEEFLPHPLIGTQAPLLIDFAQWRFARWMLLPSLLLLPLIPCRKTAFPSLPRTLATSTLVQNPGVCPIEIFVNRRWILVHL